MRETNAPPCNALPNVAAHDVAEQQGDSARRTSSSLQESEEPDFYMEDGFVVFTAAFLRRRGYCCENGCRHCPYRGDAVERGEC